MASRVPESVSKVALSSPSWSPICSQRNWQIFMIKLSPPGRFSRQAVARFSFASCCEWRPGDTPRLLSHPNNDQLFISFSFIAAHRFGGLVDSLSTLLTLSTLSTLWRDLRKVWETCFLLDLWFFEIPRYCQNLTSLKINYKKGTFVQIAPNGKSV